MGIATGMATCLVLTGDATREKLKASDLKPTLVLDELGGLLAHLTGGREVRVVDG
jgi:ribonucleotide monophosphatase NagD (HAD superfamily)